MSEKIENIIKISLKLINVLVILGAIGVLSYYYGYLKLEKYFVEKGFNIAINQIFQYVEQNEKITLKNCINLDKDKNCTEYKDLTLIIKTNAEPTTK